MGLNCIILMQLGLSLLTTAAVASPLARERSSGDFCREPASLIDGTIHSDSLRDQDTLPIEFRDVNSSFIAIREERRYSGGQCAIDVTKSYLRFRNLCPTYGVFTHDANRIPSRLPETRCCGIGSEIVPTIDFPRCQTGISKRICEKIMDYKIVLRKVRCNQEKMFEYRHVIEPVQVGCACAYPQVKTSNTRTHLASDPVFKRSVGN